jgi:hypothetical protein
MNDLHLMLSTDETEPAPGENQGEFVLRVNVPGRGETRQIELANDKRGIGRRGDKLIFGLAQWLHSVGKIVSEMVKGRNRKPAVMAYSRYEEGKP